MGLNAATPGSGRSPFPNVSGAQTSGKSGNGVIAQILNMIGAIRMFRGEKRHEVGPETAESAAGFQRRWMQETQDRGRDSGLACVVSVGTTGLPTPRARCKPQPPSSVRVTTCLAAQRNYTEGSKGPLGTGLASRPWEGPEKLFKGHNTNY